MDLLSEENVKKYILPHYDMADADIIRIKFKNTDKQRAVYKVNYSNKNYCLKKVYFDESNLLFVYSAIEWLSRNGIRVPRILPTIRKNRFVKYKGMLFIMTPWIIGVKCSYDDSLHLLYAISNLSKMHLVSKNFFPIDGSKLRVNFENIYISFQKHLNQLLNCSNLAFKYKDKFSTLFLRYFEINFMLAKISARISSNINYKNLSVSLCHLDYVNKNIIFDEENNIWVIDFDKCSIDYCAHDISYFFRRFLKRNSTNWRLDTTISCLELYEKTFPLTLDDYKYIISYLSFPQKFWKISRDYYNNILKCNHNSFIYLLKKYSSSCQNQLKFTIEFGKYIEKKFDTTFQ
ncbi:MAG TPA: CotS family spore coat protein [Clostridium sp.]|jgi:CotS family spore coat protein|uniref:CotS family spore coat protein n=1 Tax=Clostridium lapidicellarium TaxID=3240931 RepID=A0ABV4DXL9_9CLOT|nr:CotS family spore coat protein [uncultured Clostridium sp.]NLU07063.1 CotS family spore coat protein [Clostridiales bacterium]HBC96035.1 CotS family spore coat protein [Clostridium sp.]